MLLFRVATNSSEWIWDVAGARRRLHPLALTATNGTRSDARQGELGHVEHRDFAERVFTPRQSRVRQWPKKTPGRGLELRATQGNRDDGGGQDSRGSAHLRRSLKPHSRRGRRSGKLKGSHACRSYAAPSISNVKTSFFALCGITCALTLSAPAATLAPVEPAPAGVAIPCKIVSAERPQFPIRMMKAGVTHGTVHLLLLVNSQGQLVDTLVTAHTRRDFADESLRAVAKWKFEPGTLSGTPTDTVIDLTFNFEVDGVLFVVKTAAEQSSDSYTGIETLEYRVCRLQNLDRLPTPLNVVSPTYPAEWAEQGLIGNFAVDFYIDESGRTRFPTPEAGANPRLAGLAVAAVEKWRFNPPTSKGEPVLVRVRQNFKFDREASR